MIKSFIKALKQYLSDSNMAPEERFLSKAVDLADLERRLRILDSARRDNAWAYRRYY